MKMANLLKPEYQALSGERLRLSGIEEEIRDIHTRISESGLLLIQAKNEFLASEKALDDALNIQANENKTIQLVRDIDSRIREYSRQKEEKALEIRSLEAEICSGKNRLEVCREELDNITRKIDQDDTFLSYHESDSSLVESFSGIDQIISSFLKSCSVLEIKRKNMK